MLLLSAENFAVDFEAYEWKILDYHVLILLQ